MKSKPVKEAQKSLKEEKKAVADYTKREKGAPSSLKKVFRHAKSEEKKHAASLKTWIAKN